VGGDERAARAVGADEQRGARAAAEQGVGEAREGGVAGVQRGELARVDRREAGARAELGARRGAVARLRRGAVGGAARRGARPAAGRVAGGRDRRGPRGRRGGWGCPRGQVAGRGRGGWGSARRAAGRDGGRGRSCPWDRSREGALGAVLGDRCGDTAAGGGREGVGQREDAGGGGELALPGGDGARGGAVGGAVLGLAELVDEALAQGAAGDAGALEQLVGVAICRANDRQEELELARAAAAGAALGDAEAPVGRFAVGLGVEIGDAAAQGGGVDEAAQDRLHAGVLAQREQQVAGAARVVGGRGRPPALGAQGGLSRHGRTLLAARARAKKPAIGRGGGARGGVCGLPGGEACD
jgi:hypothetical protein